VKVRNEKNDLLSKIQAAKVAHHGEEKANHGDKKSHH
jgi:hypothetical protein